MPTSRTPKMHETPIIADSPLQHLAGVRPARLRMRCAKLENCCRGRAAHYTTHYMEEAERLCDRVGIIDHGSLVALRRKWDRLRLADATCTALGSLADARGATRNDPWWDAVLVPHSPAEDVVSLPQIRIEGYWRSAGFDVQLNELDISAG